MKQMRFFIVFATILFLIIGYKTYEQYYKLQDIQKLMILNESQSLAQLISSFRKTYQNVFFRHNIEINDQNINLLPVKTIIEISDRFSNSLHGDIVIRTISDRPRNIKNMANHRELIMINYFRNNPKEVEHFIEENNTYYYTKPILIEKSCLRCHGKREDVISSIREKYNKAYDYKIGEIRGLLNIEIKDKNIFGKLYDDFRETVITTLILYIIFLIIIYKLIKIMHKKDEKYTHKLEIDIKDKKNKIKKQNYTLEYQAYHDALTGLPNRMLFNDRLQLGIEISKRDNLFMALFFIDLDNFKNINDSLGHQVGDEVLVYVAERLLSTIDKDDTLARIGGDEFTIIMSNIEDIKTISTLANKIKDILKNPFTMKNHTFYVSCSIGISIYPNDSDNCINLIKFADTAMYKAKDEGKNNYQFYSSDMTKVALDRITMEANLRKAIEEREFIVYYQAQIDCSLGELIGLEALLRWESPQKGMILPNNFLPLAQETGLIIEIDQWVMKEAMKQVALWQEKNLYRGKLALNVSIRQLMSDCFPKRLKDMLKETKFITKYLELEITEKEMIKKPEEIILRLNQITKMGIKIAIDDFGTGYSSLTYLKQLPIDKLKIDHSFIQGIPKNKDDKAIVKSVIALAKGLNLNVIAEGVETDAQKEFLIQNGCNNIQGYYYNKPMSAEEIEKRYF